MRTSLKLPRISSSLLQTGSLTELQSACPRPSSQGALFPLQEQTGSWDVADFESVGRCEVNHASFFQTHGGSEPPGLEILRTHVDKGHALLFESISQAESFLQGKVFPAPLGNVSKAKPSGELKHRLVQDLRINRVNELARLQERQVLPRGQDHAADICFAADWCPTGSDGVSVLILDFTDAFMSIPLVARGDAL